MADKQINALTAASALSTADLFVVEQGGNSRKATGSQVAAVVAASTDYEGGPRTPPTIADLATWDNQGTSTVTDGSGAMVLKPQVDNVIHGRYKAAPSTPYDIYLRGEVLLRLANPTGTQYTGQVGILLKDTGGDNERLVFAIGFEHTTGNVKHYWTGMQRWSGASPPVFSAQPFQAYTSSPWKWIRVNNDGTTLTLYASMDGRNWVTIGTETLAAYIDAAASYGVYASSFQATECTAVISYFSTVAPT